MEIAARFPQAPTAIFVSLKKDEKSISRLRARKGSENTGASYRVAAFQTFLSGRISTFGDSVSGRYRIRIELRQPGQVVVDVTDGPREQHIAEARPPLLCTLARTLRDFENLVLIRTVDGGGYSRRQNLAMTRWREATDGTPPTVRSG